MVVEIVLLAFAVALLRGGSFHKLADVELKHLWLAFVVPVVILVLFAARKLGFESQVLQISQLVHILGIVPWVLLLWFNRKITGATFIILGLVLNLLPITTNSGRMPVSVERMRVANVSPERVKYISTRKLQYHCVMTKDTRFNWLADWIPVPAPPFYIQPTVISPGDVFCTAGLFLFIQCAMGVSRRKTKNEVNA